MYRLIAVYSAVALSALLAPFAALVYYGYGPFFSNAAFGEGLLRSIGVTLLASSAAVLVNIAFFTPVAFYAARKRNAVINALTDIPASVPHPIVGIALVLLASPQTAVGRFLNSLGVSLFDSYIGLVAALVIVSAPVYIRSAQSYFEALPREPELMAVSMGAGEARVFWYVFRGSARGLLSSGLTAMSRAISEFGAVAIIAYYVSGPPFGLASPASVYIWNSFETYYLSAIPEAATLLLFSLAVLAVAHALRSR
ncbi:sulfate transport system permease [Thermoproteus uzoniensis 768-20]|uniref:Sulfate transport system permease n=1 Tax=Thermoproteus uzoniensis (strain 768-20) TaxID=999630 RepID=F2L3M8_THEU7|nr:ABC transporter permease [Thermoproteus uzoniensis]AEA12012.1 sulfate transport system permease [Thermoproteus uzoniensis 768-20]